MVQQIALRIHAARRPGRTVTAAHATNHLTAWEDSNLVVLHGLHVRVVGDRNRLFTAADLASAGNAGDVASALWELPQRDLGGELPEWAELQTQLSLASAAGVATHLDGARIVQAAPYYDRPLDEICRPFDTVYLSLYKDLGAPRGAVLAGDHQVIAEAKRWRHRLGGTIDEAWPIALLALDGLETIPPLMPRLVAHARAIAAEIQRSTSATVRPRIPHGAMFHIHLPVPADAARRAHGEIVRDGGLALTLGISTASDPLRSWFESTIGPNALSIDALDVAAAVNDLIELAERQNVADADRI